MRSPSILFVSLLGLSASTAYCGESNPCASPPLKAGEGVFTVNSTADTTDGVCDLSNCTLREALASPQSPGSDTQIQFSQTLFSTPQTINLLTALPNLMGNVRLRGTGAKLLTVQRALAAPEFSVFTISPGSGNVVMCGLTIRQGFSQQDGGAIFSQRFLFLFDVHITGNVAQRGGGVALIGASGIFTGSTFSSNIAADRGGAIYIEPFNSSFDLINSTLSGNRGNTAGGGIAIGGNSTGNTVFISNSTIANNMSDAANVGAGIFDGTTSNRPTRLRSTLLANNTPLNITTNATATVASDGFNLSSDDGSGLLTSSSDKIFALAGLGPLADNGGSTMTHALQNNSAAIDAGVAQNSTDQRGPGFLRTIDLAAINAIGGDGTDIGAFEVQSDVLFKNGFE
jgi:CSLREA domain-containing protein